jgi:hypothetical protein
MQVFIFSSINSFGKYEHLMFADWGQNMLWEEN